MRRSRPKEMQTKIAQGEGHLPDSSIGCRSRGLIRRHYDSDNCWALHPGLCPGEWMTTRPFQERIGTSMRTKAPLAALAAGMVSLPGLVAVSCAPANNGGSRQNVSTPAPSTTTSVTTPSAAATTAAPQPAATVTEPPIATGPVLQPMEKSGVMLETKARHTVCQVLYDSVACLGHFTDPRACGSTPIAPQNSEPRHGTRT